VTKKERFLGVAVDVVKVAFQNKTGTEIRVNGRKNKPEKFSGLIITNIKKKKQVFIDISLNNF
jgi:hypothetical protein